MNKSFKKKLMVGLIIISGVLAVYGGFRLYNYVVADITRRVKEGVSKGITDTLNPLKWPGKIFGRRKDK